ncbi:hypothetical protein RHGRI_002566 [Rhododendron griersonianum]|uniref:Uncharacterized protein n=1 Tax=Rhododendron griersonianum TaxID=479676 RepID=A0AAV6LPC7_9ERIC|nr:hypothetical protein RHGRI_002566 [Rhododendron griersonianum]
MPADLFIPFRDLEDERVALQICLLIWSETRNQRDGHGTNEQLLSEMRKMMKFGGSEFSAFNCMVVSHTCGDSEVLGALQSY